MQTSSEVSISQNCAKSTDSGRIGGDVTTAAAVLGAVVGMGAVVGVGSVTAAAAVVTGDVASSAVPGAHGCVGRSHVV